MSAGVNTNRKETAHRIQATTANASHATKNPKPSVAVSRKVGINMGTSLSCLKPGKEGGAVRAVPERRPVSASELRRPNSSFSASTSLTLEPKRRMSVDVQRTASPNDGIVDTTEVLVLAAEKLTVAGEQPGDRASQEVSEKVVEHVVEVVDDDKDDEHVLTIGSTSDDIGATGNHESDTVDLIDIHVRADKALVSKASGASRLPERAPSLESMPKSLDGNSYIEKQVVDVDVAAEGMVSGGMDRVRKKDDKRFGKSRTKELQRSNTMLDVRSILPVHTHVTNYEKIDAEAKVDAEEVVKSGRLSSEA